MATVLEDQGADTNLSVSELCRLLGLSLPTVYRLLERGQLPGVKVGKLHRMSRRALSEFLYSPQRNSTRK
jgi:excisionase family DNA binding protein